MSVQVKLEVSKILPIYSGRELGISREYEYIKNSYMDQYQFFTQADISDTKEALGYEPRYSLEEGIKEYIPEIKDYLKWK